MRDTLLRIQSRQSIKGAVSLFCIVTTIYSSSAVAQSEPPEIELDEIIVTATKRSEALQDVSASIAAYREKDLILQGISDFSELAGNVPGVSMQEGGPGYRSVYIRGIATENGNSPTTGVYIDESFLPPGGIIQNIIEPVYFDVARVEVLRGPQGTLFGGGSMGGTLRVINNQPSIDGFEAAVGGEISTTNGGGFNYETSAMVNIPLVDDKVAFRAAVTYRDKDGYVDKIVAPAFGSTAGDTLIENINDEEFFAIRAAMKWVASDKLEVTPSILYQKSNAANLGAADTPPLDLTMRRQVNVDEPVEDEFLLGNLLVTYDLGDYEILSSTSYSQRDNFFEEDGSDYTAEVFLQFPFYVPTVVTGDGVGNLFTQELRVATTGDQRLQFVAGGYYENFSRDGGLLWIIPGAEAAFPFFAAFFPGDVAFDSSGTLDRKHISLFGEATYQISDKFSATVGLRWFDYDIETSSTIRGVLGDHVKTSENGVNPKFTLTYEASDDHLIYTTVSQGFRPGGPNRIVPDALLDACTAEYEANGLSIGADGQIEGYESDQIWNYEVGSKNKFNDQVTLNFAAYYINWSDIQQGFSAQCGIGSTQNFGEAKIYGLEMDFNAQVSSQFRVFGGLNYNDATLADDVPNTNLTKGLKIQSAPKWSFNVSGQYEFTSPIGEAFVLVNYRYTDDSFRDFNQDDTPLNRRRFQESYSTLNARLGIVEEDWMVAIFADNLTNEAPVVGSFLSTFGHVPSRDRYFTLRPRTIGVSFRRNF